MRVNAMPFYVVGRSLPPSAAHMLLVLAKCCYWVVVCSANCDCARLAECVRLGDFDQQLGGGMHEGEIALAQCSCGIEGVGRWGAELVGPEEAVECHTEGGP